MFPFAHPSRICARLTVSAVVALLAVSTTRADFTINLTTAGSSGTAGGALYYQADPQPTGTGYIDPFVRIHNTDPQTSTERGYNTEGQIEFDTKDNGGHNWTHSLLLTDLQAVTIGTTQYYQFGLDINEINSPTGRLLSMNDFRLYLGNAPDLTNWSDGFGANSVKVYDIDATGNGDGTVELDYSLNSGSGSGDMFVYIPVTNFSGHTGFNYVYLYSSFSQKDDGFEEWWAFTNREPAPGPNPVPAPASALLLLTGLPGLALVRYRRRMAVQS